MSLANQVLFDALTVLGYFGSPIGLIWGWLRWMKVPRQRSIPANLSLAGFLLASTSALLAVGSISYAQVHRFGFYDPVLMRIFSIGFLLSLSAIVTGIAGIWKSSPLRWHAPVCALTTTAFWLMAAAGE